uniref:SFRICE_020758 n=1 Tax=Spodoptera frugiperda TaxID=7108 RepID=A0A2H1WPV1_SPOFR
MYNYYVTFISLHISSTLTNYKWPLLTKGLFSHGEGLSINHHACSMRVGDFKLDQASELLCPICGGLMALSWDRDAPYQSKADDDDDNKQNIFTSQRLGRSSKGVGGLIRGLSKEF